MKNLIHSSSCAAVALVLTLFAVTTSVQAQNGTFRPYKGICWGLFYDSTAEILTNTMIPVAYERRAIDTLVLPDFVGCGRDMVITLTDVGNAEGYWDVFLEMEGGAYDESTYFYAPFNAGEYKWTFTAPNGELIGPIQMYSSYYHEPLDYLGLYYYGFDKADFAYFDVKMSEDYYAHIPRTYIEEEEGINTVLAPAAKPDANYDLNGRCVIPHSNGVSISNGRKVIR